jgi:hypothetical protein
MPTNNTNTHYHENYTSHPVTYTTPDYVPPYAQQTPVYPIQPEEIYSSSLTNTTYICPPIQPPPEEKPYQPPVTATTVVVQSSESYKDRDRDTLVFVLFIAGFFFHWLWLVAWIVSRKRAGTATRMLGRLSCGLFSIGCCLLFVVIVVCAIAIPVAVTARCVGGDCNTDAF